jgi:hypothetical protein
MSNTEQTQMEISRSISSVVEKDGSRIVQTAVEARGAVRPCATCWYGAWAFLWRQWHCLACFFSKLKPGPVAGRFWNAVAIRFFTATNDEEIRCARWFSHRPPRVAADAVVSFD